MVETNPVTVNLAGEEVFAGKEYDLGVHRFSEDEIIRFARHYDPLWLHTDPEAAARGPWKGIIASGPMLFVEFHKHFWIPRFGGCVIAGMGIYNWEFFEPHRPDQDVRGLLKVEQADIRPDGRSAVVHWKYRFFDLSGNKIQQAEYKVIHATGGHTWKLS